jgi:DNA-binding NarL/FixJ family response regulator
MARVGFTEDIAACYVLHRSLGLPYSKDAWHALPDMWGDMLSKGAMKLFLVEDRLRPVESRIVSFNAAVIVTEDFCLQARSMISPYLGVKVAQQYLSQESPVLNPEQVAHANASAGVNMMMCFEGWAHHELSREQWLMLREKQSEAFHLAVGGYRVREFVADSVQQETLQWMLDAGARLRYDYSNYFRNNRAHKAQSSQGPWLVGLTKEEAFAHPGTKIADLFIFSPPRFHFTRAQQALLQHALMGKTCETLAASLSVSTWTVKKRWHAIYDRVADVDRELLPPSIAYSAEVSSRGMERRRQLLNYLRQHLEELRPYAKQSLRSRS